MGGAIGRVVRAEGGRGGREGGRGGREGGGGREGEGEGGREGAPVKEGRVKGRLMKGTSEERTERGMDGARERGEVGSEWRRD